MEELSYVFTQYFVSCVHVRFHFSLPIIFTLLAAGISHCLTAALIFMFFFLQNSSLPFSITRSSSFSVIQVSVNIKNNVKKRHEFVVFSFLKSGRPCDFFPNKTLSCISVAIPVDWIILHWYACGADGISVGVWPRDYQTSYPWCSSARASRARAAQKKSHSEISKSPSK